MADDAGGDGTKRDDATAAAPAPEASKTKKRRGGLLSRAWGGIFGGRRSEDYEKKLRHLSKEEASVHSRMKRRVATSRKVAKNTIVLSALLEMAAVGYAIITTRSLDLTWQMRAIRVFPMFALPPLCMLIYSGLVSFTRILDRKDQKTLERLRAERKANIDELKERTNYYITQQLIQRYDLDPAAKAAAATVLASKLGEESGLKVRIAAEDNPDSALGRSGEAEPVQPSAGLRNRRGLSHARSHSTGSSPTHPYTDHQMHANYGPDMQEVGASPDHRIVEHHSDPSPSNGGGWLARLAALLVGEDPSQCYALICGNCHMHNGLARKEDFPYITYYCPHCRALNGGSRQRPDGLESLLGSGGDTPTTSGGVNVVSGGSPVVANDASWGGLATVHELPAGASDEEKELEVDDGASVAMEEHQ